MREGGSLSSGNCKSSLSALSTVFFKGGSPSNITILSEFFTHQNSHNACENYCLAKTDVVSVGFLQDVALVVLFGG